MVHVHEVDHALVQAGLACGDDALGDVSEDRIARRVGSELVVRRGLARLEILDKVFRCERLTEVVVVGADPDQPTVGADRVRRELRHVRHHQAVLPRPRRLLGDLLEKRLRKILELEQLALGDLADQQLIDRHEHACEHAREHRSQRGGHPGRARRLRELAERYVTGGEVLEHRICQRGEQGRRTACDEQRGQPAFRPLRDHQPGSRRLDEQQQRDADIERHAQRHEQRRERPGSEPDDPIHDQGRDQREHRDRHDQDVRRCHQHRDLHDHDKERDKREVDDLDAEQPTTRGAADVM